MRAPRIWGSRSMISRSRSGRWWTGSRWSISNVDDQAIPIFLTAQTVSITRPADLGNLYVRSRESGLVPLSSLTRFTEEGVAAELDRTEQRRAIEVQAVIAPGVPLADAIAEIERLSDEVLAEGIEPILQGGGAAARRNLARNCC